MTDQGTDRIPGMAEPLRVCCRASWRLPGVAALLLPAAGHLDSVIVSNEKRCAFPPPL
jgi:hypothetical protein